MLESLDGGVVVSKQQHFISIRIEPADRFNIPMIANCELIDLILLVFSLASGTRSLSLWHHHDETL